MSSIDNFMRVWFPQLNTDCQGQILKNVSFCPEIKFNKDDVIKISKNGVIIITSDEPKWMGKNIQDWEYKCVNKFNCCGCLRKDFFSIKTLTQESLLKKELSFIKCKNCHKQMCSTCYNREVGIYKTNILFCIH